MADSSVNATGTGYTDPLLNRFFESPAERENKKNGYAIIKAFYTQQTSQQTNLNFFLGRKARWNEMLLWAKGSQQMKEFLDYMSVSDANKAWVNIDMTQQRIAAQFVGTLVESMAKIKLFPSVKAVDNGSLSEKEERMLDALIRMYEKPVQEAIEQEAGFQLEPSNVYIPEDEFSAKVYFELEDRLPKEIRFEQMLASVLNNVQFDRILNRKGLYDMITLNFEATKIEKVKDKEYTIRKCVPTNMIYNFFMNDTGECEVTMVGEFYNLKVRDFREKFAKSPTNPNGLTEKEIFDLCQLTTNKNIGKFNYIWNQNWAINTYNYTRPYDDLSILVLDCEIDCGEDVYYTDKKDAFGKSNIREKKGIPQPQNENVEVIKRKKNTWMRGIYAPYGDKLLYWGRPDVIISHYSEYQKTLSSYTINIPNNDGEYVPSLFERIMEPLKEYTLTKLKRKQLIAKIRPTGIRIDVESARNIDLGSGNSIEWEEVLRIFDQTGNEIWSSKGLNPLEQAAPPFSTPIADPAVQKIMDLTNILNGIRQEIRELIGVPYYRDGADVGDRTSGKLAESQNQSSYNVTDFVLNGHLQCWEQTLYKVCLLHWNDIVKTEPESASDLINTRFEVAVRMKSTEYQKELLERDIDRYSQTVDNNGNPLLSPADAMMLREIDDDKLARLYMVKTIEKNKKESLEKSMMLQQQNAQVQQQSMIATEQEKQKSLQAELAVDLEKKRMEDKAKKEQIFLQSVGDMRKAGIPVPRAWQQVEMQILQGLSMTTLMSNEVSSQEMQAMEQEQLAMQEQQQMTQQQQPQEETVMEEQMM